MVRRKECMGVKVGSSEENLGQWNGIGVDDSPKKGRRNQNHSQPITDRGEDHPESESAVKLECMEDDIENELDG